MEQDKKDRPDWMSDNSHDELTNGRGDDDE